MFPSFLTAMTMPDECEREADGRLHTDGPLLLLFNVTDSENSALTVTFHPLGSADAFFLFSCTLRNDGILHLQITTLLKDNSSVSHQWRK